jgi:chemotaxis protein methyltransferase CheR
MTTASPAGRQTTTRQLSAGEFKLFQGLIHREAGIWLSDAKKALLVGRLSRRLRDLGLSSFDDYHRYVTEQDPQERVRMLDCVSTNETHFFREPKQFEFLAGEILPTWIAQAARGERPRRVRVWSAACSTGEEPYTLAMMLLGHLPQQGWEIDILGSDISTRVLGRAQEATWPIGRAAEIPEPYQKRFMLRGTRSQAGLMKASAELRQLVRFERLNLIGATLPEGRFDLVFCRNVLIYFDAPTKARVLSRLASLLEPTGYLFLGHAESVLGMADRLRRVGPTIYTAAAS